MTRLEECCVRCPGGHVICRENEDLCPGCGECGSCCECVDGEGAA